MSMDYKTGALAPLTKRKKMDNVMENKIFTLKMTGTDDKWKASVKSVCCSNTQLQCEMIHFAMEQPFYHPVTNICFETDWEGKFLAMFYGKSYGTPIYTVIAIEQK